MALNGTVVTFAATPTSLLTAMLKGRPGPTLTVKQLDVLAGPSNEDNVHIGGSDVASTTAWAVLIPGKSWSLEEDIYTVGADIYIHGTEAEVAHLIWVE